MTTMVIFGASGDLTSRKLIPALYSLFCKGRLPAGTKIVGVSRTPYSHEQWRAELAETSRTFVGKEFNLDTWTKFAEQVYYHPGDIGRPEDFPALKAFLESIEGDAAPNRLFYLSTAPQLYENALKQLGASGLAVRNAAACRVVIEKPFGTDLASAKHLNAVAHEVLDEAQIYRIDHYLGKETVQNLLVLRFANSIFEPIWNRNYIDHVQITVAEEVAVGSRAGYYDKSGVLRDMFQNHILQLMMITAMEAPSHYSADLVRDEKVKVLRAVRPLTGADFAHATMRGQYTGYRDEDDVPEGSMTATWAALKLEIENWRWNGVPFYLRSGKAMSCRTSQIVVQFRDVPHLLFAKHDRRRPLANRLVIQIQPAEGLELEMQSKVPDAGMRLRTTHLDFSFREAFEGEMPDSYQRLLLDALKGDASLFARSDEVELAWSIIDPILAAWQSPAAPPLELYEPGGWGPEQASEWMDEQHRHWYDVCPVLT